MTADKLYLGIDLGGTKILTGLINSGGTLLAQDYRKTKARKGPEAVVQRMAESATEVIAAAGIVPEDVQAVGIGAPGPVNVIAGVVTSPPNLPGWVQVPLRQLIQEALGIPAFLENDANAAALGEYLFGAGRGYQDIIYITVSTGIGGGLILNGRLYHGIDGAAAEVGHMTVIPNGPRCGCGNQGCLEAVSSGTAIAREAKELLNRGVPTLISELAADDPEDVSARIVAQAAQQGDAEAQEIVRKAMDYLGIGIANLVNIFNPELVIIGGSLTKLGEMMFDRVQSAVNRRAFRISAQRVKIVPAELGDRVGIFGAAAVAIQASNENALPLPCASPSR